MDGRLPAGKHGGAHGQKQETALTVPAPVARRLHDDVMQRLSGVMAALSVEAPLAPADQRRCRVELEAIRNAVKHARATSIAVSVQAFEKEAFIDVSNDGVSPGSADSTGTRLGL